VVFINIALLFAFYPLVLSMFSIGILFNDIVFSKIYGGILGWHRNSFIKLVKVLIVSSFLLWANNEFILFLIGDN